MNLPDAATCGRKPTAGEVLFTSTMLPKHFSTQTPLGNGHYPSLLVNWTRDEDEMGYKGECSIWKDGNTLFCKGHVISIRQCNPIGTIAADVDSFGPGCWAMTRFEGTGITERDLQWVAAWAGETIRRKHDCVTRCMTDPKATLED